MAFIVAVGWIKVVEDLKDFDEYEKVSRFFYVHIFTDTAVLKSLTSKTSKMILKMKKRIILLTVMFLLSLPFETITAQTKKQQSQITIAMARKISIYCQYNQRALQIFAAANPEQVQNRMDYADRLLRELDQHLDCAENFIYTLYYNYGKSMAYFALKDAGFTIKETNIAEAYWEKELEKIEIENKQREIQQKEEIELAIKERINENDIFSKDELAREATINWTGIKSIYNNRALAEVFRTRGSSEKYSICIDKDGTLTANYGNDSFINEYVFNILESNRHIPGKILFKNDSVDVKTYVSLNAELIIKGYSLNVKKSKKGWELKTDIESNSKGVKAIVSELIDLLNNSDLSQLENNKYHIETYIATYCLNQKIFVQTTLMHIYLGYSNNNLSPENNDSRPPVHTIRYPLSEYDSLYQR